MIISRTPFRVSFFGGGTDYPVWFKEHGGAVLGTTVNKYCYIMVRPFSHAFPNRYRLVYATEEFVNDVSEIRHPSIRECLKFMEIEEGLEIIHWTDLPARRGMGSSSAFTVGLLNALYALKGEIVSKTKLAQDAIYIEQSMIGENVGCQDQYHCSFGGLNQIVFLVGGQVGIESNFISPPRKQILENHLMLFDTGSSRIASLVALEQIRLTPWRYDELISMQKMVYEATEVLEKGDLQDFGLLLHLSWTFKRSLTSKISTPIIDAFYDAARKAGAVGGKLLGAGGGGFMLFYVEPDRQDAVRKALNLKSMPFKFENKGSQVIYGGKNER